MIGVTIRKGCMEDIPALAHMVGETIVRVNSRDYTAAQITAWASRASSPGRWKELFASGLVFFVAENPAGEIIGISSVDSKGYLHSMFVDYRYQGRGIASALLDEARQYAVSHAAEEMTSEVSITARLFFLARGFRVEKEQEVVAGGVPMTNYLMRRKL